MNVSIVATFHKLPASDRVNVNFKVFKATPAAMAWAVPTIDYTFPTFYETTQAFSSAIHGIGNIRNKSINTRYVSTLQMSIQHVNVVYGGLPYNLVQGTPCTLTMKPAWDDTLLMSTIYNQPLRPLMCSNPNDILTAAGCFTTSSRLPGCQDNAPAAAACPYPLPGFFTVSFR